MNRNDKVVVVAITPVLRDTICKIGLKGYVEAVEKRNEVEYIFFQSTDVCGWLPAYCVRKESNSV
jgi:hypothetical protein